MFIAQEMSEYTRVEEDLGWNSAVNEQSSEGSVIKLNTRPFPAVDGLAVLSDKSLLM